MIFDANITITGSKSETNRLLLLQALSKHAFEIENLSNSKDSQVMQQALASNQTEVNIGIAGTAMRFLTAYFAVQKGRQTLLTGEGRMLERPIGVLVDALRRLGVTITYEANEGFPPIMIYGTDIQNDTVIIPANISSQYITALMLIAPFTQKGLTIQLDGKITSIPYIKMTLQLLQRAGVECSFSGATIQVKPSKIRSEKQVVESDWSSASYYYALMSMGEGEIRLQSFREDSLQGDKQLVEIYKQLGVNSSFNNNELILSKIKNFQKPDFLTLDLNQTPDIAQTIAVNCFALQIKCKLLGLETLKIKETDRLAALQHELTKFGAVVEITDNSLEIKSFDEPQTNIEVKTYHDHRMAMAFAPLLLKYSFTIENPAVVEKSYPDFWEDMKKVGVNLL